jgi:hypothetical protein
MSIPSVGSVRAFRPLAGVLLDTLHATPSWSIFGVDSAMVLNF